MDRVLEPGPAPAASRLPHPCRPEVEVLDAMSRRLSGLLDWPLAAGAARSWVQAVRASPAPFWAMDSLLREYPISSAEGLALMRLAEALLRVPDAETAIALTSDQLGRADFDQPTGGPHPRLANLSAGAIAMSKRLLPRVPGGDSLLGRFGAQSVVAATVRALQLLGRQFVLGEDIDSALGEAGAARRGHPAWRYSYDMLGEGARTDADALRYLASYHGAIDALAGDVSHARAGHGPEARDGVSIKLSALFARYEESQRARVFERLLPRVSSLVDAAAASGINLTIDAEESDRLELSLDLFECLARHAAARCPHWQGLGLAVQAYQTRSLEAIDAVGSMARAHRLRPMVRLVKGAYWDSEIKRAQELGLAGYPVFTRKHHTDLAFLACASELIQLAAKGLVFPQFATHNAGSIAAVLQMTRAAGIDFELQRLHGMGEGLYREVLRGRADLPLRIYAPVGRHRDLLAYLVRRLLENGANSSFVHQLADPDVDPQMLLASPLVPSPVPGIAPPVALYGWNPQQPGTGRPNARGVDLACAADREPLLRALAAARPAPVPEASLASVNASVRELAVGQLAWDARPLAERADILRRAADRLEAQLDHWCGLLVVEAGKTLGDAVAEVREAVDFLRYYAEQAQLRLAPQLLPGPTGERNTLRLRGRGVFVCISPWNFPLAIFTGQVAAALVCGNAVAAKPAEQTPAVAHAMVELLHGCGVPRDALRLLHGPGETVGAALASHPLTAGVCFTGSTAVARTINRTLAAKDGPIVPLIAETGGINAMLVDSSALAEQVVDAVVQSAFRSAGQRCSALRLLCVHERIADEVIEMLRGAIAELQVGDPARFATDVGPVIDAAAHADLAAEIERLGLQARLIGRSPFDADPQGDPTTARWQWIAPVAFEVARIADVQREIFGPVLHVVRWSGDAAAVVAEINALGYGLTFGVQSRIDTRALQLAGAVRAGNVYVNRNMIGAVVGVQPFGGEGLSGSGPKAGGPHYLYRFCSEQTLTINTAAAGGNVELLSDAAP